MLSVSTIYCFICLHVGILLKRRPLLTGYRASFTYRRIRSACGAPARSLLMSAGLVTPLVVSASGFGLYPWHLDKPPLNGRFLEYAQFDPNFTIICLLAMNSAVFLLWRLGRRGAGADFGEPVTKRMMEAKSSVYKYPPNVRFLNDKRSFWLGQFMRRHFMSSSARTFSRNGCHTAVTSVFSHETWPHFLVNMSVLWLFGGGVHEMVGREAFLGIFIGALTFWCNNFYACKTSHQNVTCEYMSIVLCTYMSSVWCIRAPMFFIVTR